MTSAGLREVHLLQLPVPLWAKAQQRTEELLREFALAAASADEGNAHHLPRRLTELISALTATFGDVSTAQEQQLFEASDAGEQVLAALEFAVPPEAAPACQVLGDMLDEADDYCRDGEYLLSLAAPEDVVAFRRWYLSEFIRQLAEQPPTPWPQYDGFWPRAQGS